MKHQIRSTPRTLRPYASHVLLLCALIGLSFGCASSRAGSSELNVGFLYDSATSDMGWTSAHDQGRKYLESKLPGIKTTFAENIPETSEAQRVLEKMVAKGAKLIFTTSFGFLEPVLKTAERHPDVTFMQVNRSYASKNVGTYYCYIYEPIYVAGVIAGKMTRSNKLGMIGGHPTPVVMQLANAFILGARSVNPRATLKVVWINNWSDPPLEAESVKGLKEAGVDVVTQAMDSNSTMVRTAESLGIYSVGNYVDAHELGPKGWLTGSCFNWGPLYLRVTSSVLNHTWKPSVVETSMKDDAIKLATIGSAVPPALRKQAVSLAADIKSGRFVVFQGPVKDRDGKERLPTGQRPDAKWLAAMNFFVEGVDGALPKK